MKEKSNASEPFSFLFNIFGHILARLSCAKGWMRGSFLSIQLRVKGASWGQGGKTKKVMKF